MALKWKYKNDEEYLADLKKCTDEGDESAKQALIFYHYGGDVIEETEPDVMRDRWNQ